MKQSTTFHIRAATAEDAPTIAHLIRALADYENLAQEVTGTVEELRTHLFEKPGRAEVLLACEDQTPVGIALFFHNFSTFLARPGLYIEDIFVLPGHRGKGYGRALMIQLARVAEERGCGRMEWAVLDWNQPAMDFYKSLGAVPMSEWTIQRVPEPALKALAARRLFADSAE